MATTTQPLVSIIMPMHNSEKTLVRAANSVVAQTYENWELLIVDDASQDNSEVVARTLAANEPRIKIYKFYEQSGAGAARNKAIERAKGRYIAFLDSDDEWLPKKLEKQISWMVENKISFSCTAYFRQKSEQKRSLTQVPQSANKSTLLKNNTVATLTAVYDISPLGKCYMSEIKRRQDYGLWLDLLDKTENVWGLQEPLAIYHVGSGTLSSNKLKAASAQWKFFRQQQKMPRWKAGWYFMHYAINASLRNI